MRAEYAAHAVTILPQKEYGYHGGQLLITAASGDAPRLRRFVENIYYRTWGYLPEGGRKQVDINALVTVLGQSGQTDPTLMLATAQSQLNAAFTSTNYRGSQRTHEQYVADLYLAYLQRAPESLAALQWYADFLNTNQLSRSQLRQEFADSGEFAALVSSLYGTESGDYARLDRFLQQVYASATGNAATQAQLDTEHALFDTAEAQGVTALQTAAQDLGRRLLGGPVNFRPDISTQEEYVTRLYQTFLRRAPDSSFTSYVTQAGAPNGRSAVLEQFLAMSAYRERSAALYREINWLVADHLGTPRFIVERTGSLAGLKRSDYLPFGESANSLGGRGTSNGYGGENVRQGFTGYEEDAETGLDYAQARYYGSGMGRFISVDPGSAGSSKSETQSWNGYVYVSNNPLLFIDPSGMTPTDFIDETGNRTHLDDGKDQVIYAYARDVEKLSTLFNVDKPNSEKPEYYRNLWSLEQNNQNNLHMTVAQFNYLAGVIYAESSVGNTDLREPAAIYGVLKNRAGVTGTTVLDQATTENGVYGASQKDKIFDENAPAASVKAVYLGIAISVTTGWDASNGAYFWQGADFRQHTKGSTAYESYYEVGFRFTSNSHDLWKLGDRKHEWKEKPKGEQFTYKFESTAAYGKTTFMRLNQEWMTANGRTKQWGKQ